MVQPPSDQFIQSPALEQEIDLRPYLAILARHWLLILATAVVALVATALYLFVIQRRTYSATAGVLIIPTRAELQFDPKFRTESETWRDQQARRSALVSLARSEAMATLVLETVPTSLVDETQQVSEIIKDMKATNQGDLIELTVTATTPDIATMLANNWADVFTHEVNQIYRGQSRPAQEIDTQTDNAQQNFQQAQRNLEQFLSENRLTALLQASRFKEGQIQDAYVALTRVDRLISDARWLKDRLQQGNVPAAANTQALALLRVNIANVASSPAQSFQSAASIPALQLQMSLDGNGAVAETNTQQLIELENILVSLTARRKELQDQVSNPQLQRDLAGLQQAYEAELARQRTLNHQRDVAWDTYSTLSRKKAEVAVSSQLSGNEVRLASRAVPPLWPASSGRLLSLALAGFVGLVLGVLLAFLLELIRRRRSAA